MASDPTTRNRFNKQGTGDNAGTWGIVLNAQAFDLIDEALDGVTAIPVTGNLTLTSANYTSDQARRRTLKLTGTPGATFTITIPSVEKFYIVHNTSNAPQMIKAAGAGVVVSPGALKPLYCDGTDCFSPPDTLSAPVGVMVDYAGLSPPAGWLFCAGQAVSRTAYALLFAALGTSWGTGNGTSTFNLPDRRGRSSVAPDNMGGTDAARMGHYPDRNTIGATVGANLHTLVKSQLPNVTLNVTSTIVHPPHTYKMTQYGIVGGGGVPQSQAVSETDAQTTPPANSTASGTTEALGSSGAHNNIQASIVAPVIIYAGV